MNINKRGNSYRVQKMFNGKRYSVSFDHKPTDLEIYKAFANVSEKTVYTKKTFKKAAQAYISSKENIYSPSTVREYERKIERLPESFTNKEVSSITQEDVQKIVNDLAKKRSPKTIRDTHAFISAVLKENTDIVLKTKLPQKTKKDVYIPTDEEVSKLIEYSKTESNGMYYVPIMLAIRSLRRSEICALSASDLEDNIITINKAKVENKAKEWVLKTTKTTESTRRIPIPKDVADKIREQGYVYNGSAGGISKFINRYCKKYNVQHFSIHKLRHYFASRMLSENIDIKTIEEIGGWKSDFVIKQVYAHSIDEKVNDALSKLDDILT